ncbi:MAG: hypothetical protein JZU62_03720 [Sulfuricurvum sp.]|uniref:hypothetical protein n=1 Tax=Sulfuricurvum sp. TaxID=2025608 RepID=UPI0026010DAC|nr:hypothetical protein [Sulfuricurvum sp.]MBV5320770.1 hypothetical protein [Sulfuricurvum sp.]
MKHILIYTLEIDANLILQKLLGEYEIIVCHRFADAMESIAQKVPHLIISDYNALRHDEGAFHYALHNDFIMIDIPVIAIGCFETDSIEMLSIKQKLYTFNIKRYLYIHSERIDLLQIVEWELNKWNPHLGSYTHRFVKSFLLFADSKKYEQRMRIHLTYIMSHYLLSNVAISDIKFASAILSTTFTTQNYESVLDFYTNMRFARPILQLLKNVNTPSTIEEEMLAAVFLLETHLNSPESDLIEFPVFSGIRPEVISYLRETYLEKRYFLQSYKDVIPFWEEISNLLLNNPLFDDQQISCLLEKVQECLMLVLVEYQRAYLQIVNEYEKISILITPLGDMSNTILCWAEQTLNDVTFSIDKNGVLSIALIYRRKEFQKNEITISDKDLLLHDSHGLNRYSAAEYIRDLGGINNIVDELQLMDEILVDIFNLLDQKNDLNREATRKNLIKCIREYRSVLQNNFYEFQAIALTLLKLENLLNEVKNHVELDIIKLTRLLQLVFDDLGAWKTTVFENQMVNDINYLDSSILSSSYQIETLFFPVEESIDEECEFF